MFCSSDASVWRALRVVLLLICFMTIVLPMAALADGPGPDPPVQNPDPLLSSGSDSLTTVVVTLLTVLWSTP